MGLDEIVAVDTGSHDNSLDIARAYGARVYEHPWERDFARHRNQAIEYATARYCMIIDPDEEVVDTDFERVRWYLDGRVKEPVIAVHELLLLADGTQLKLFTPRIIRKDSGIRYRFPIHEQLHSETDYEMSGSDIKLVHHGYADFEQLLAKQTRNLEIAREMGEHPHGLHTQARALLSLDRYTETIDVCRRLAAQQYSQVYRMEACGLGAAAALRVGDVAVMGEFLAIGKALDSDSPDVALLEFLAEGYRYRDLLERSGLDGDVEFTRPLVFRHSIPAITKLLDMFASRKAVARM